MWSIAEPPADAADDRPRAAMMAAPRCVDPKTNRPKDRRMKRESKQAINE
jgi:hypothetical protein